MTRFARSKGSKASNDKVPEDSTPWEVMKEQLLSAKKEKDEQKEIQKAEKQRLENYENFLKEQKTQKRKATWCDFPETPKEHISEQTNKKKKNDKAKNKQVNQNNSKISACSSDDPNELITPTQKKSKNNDNKIEVAENKDTSEAIVNNTDEADQIPIVKKKKKNKKNKVNGGTTSSSNLECNSTSFPIEEKKNNDSPKLNNKQNKKNGKPKRRKEINDNSFQLIINGKQVELVRIDGFPVMKKDAERLHELKSNMLQKGIPKSEIQRTMKLERRRAEKALARLKRDVCYNCRKGGHNLSDCPDLKSKIPGGDTSEGICFKCGSTEHRQFECKVQRDKEFRFATCFICKEAGHIARQCPDNPKGLYPNGGGCKLCGDVTHLRKDCPTVMDKKEGKSIKLQTLDSTDDVEGIGQQGQVVTSQETLKRVKKIKF
ncbi:uncharacterized protein LOC131843977 [Achroia grisella]|uniref:uncharacterized protein LOC131843977 n=1 Tax=Achroia grisella TaxID=688607 RepID=UPI0027D32FAF|nr:uncharacterized protein LOC131843977 [Achroia grisella]